MSIFSNILEKLGLKKPAETATTAPATYKDSRPAPSVTAPTTTTPAPKAGSGFAGDLPHPAPTGVQPKPAAIPMVDVVSKLEGMALRNPEKLNWKVSIVDLLKLLDIDSSYAARKELAEELGCPAEKMTDSAQMNMWLHKTVLQKLADNGGNIPKELLD